MKTIILDRIKELGGSVDEVEGKGFLEDWEAIIWEVPLYPKPKDTPWSLAQDTEPIEGISDFIAEHKDLWESDKELFFTILLNYYYGDGHQNEPNAQSYHAGTEFTPFKEGSIDFEEWEGIIKETKVREVVKGTDDPLEFLEIFWSYGYPDCYFICLSDPNPENPIVYGSDHEEFFTDIEVCGTLDEFLNSFYSPSELIQTVEERM